jgi:serine/threonine protein kinase/tetratricopeptide (TPR) repeat protein
MKCPKCSAPNPAGTSFCGRCGTAFDSGGLASCTQTLGMDTGELPRGTLFAGRYDIIEELGSGGMGKVYRAFDKKMDEEVALKLIKPEIAADGRVVERFRDEIKIARSITHRNVCRMHDLNQDGQTLYLTMEYVRGEDLKSLIRRTRHLAPDTAVTIGRQITEGLMEAHKRGIVHRDLKPQNIMIDKEGQAKIMDFGIAFSMRARGRTGESGIIGTPHYMSPEQAEGTETDPRSDIYSLGIILYEMVTGRAPFEGPTPSSICLKQRTEAPADPRALNPQVSEELSRLILKCLEKDREKKPQSAADLSSEFERLGHGTVSFNLRKAIFPALLAVGLVAAVVITGVLSPKRDPPARILPGTVSVAVLPFVDMSPSKDYEYLCEGIPETLITASTKVEGLRIPARTSAFSFKGKERDISEIGRALSVGAVLQGSVQVIGDRIRIIPQLVNVEDGSYLWSETYSRKFDEVFAIQDEIAREVIKALRITLLGEEQTPLVKKYTENLQAYDLYLRGRYFAGQRTGESLKKAIAFFDQAVETDPNYALAYAGLAECYVLLPQYTLSPTREGLTKSKAAVSKALEIDGGLAESHAAAGLIFVREWKWEEAEREYRLAIELDPNYALGHIWYALLFRRWGRLDDWSAEVKRALELDPLSPLVKTNLGFYYYAVKEYDLAIDQYLKSLQIDPNFAVARMRLGEAYLKTGRHREAIAELQMAYALFGDSPRGLGELGNAYALSGEKGKAQEVLAKLRDFSGRGYSINYDIASVHLGLGDHARTFEWLEKAVAANEYEVEFLKTNPAWDDLRPDPRFKAILKRMNLD